MALIEKLKNIANAIRSKTNKNEELTLEQMANEVSNIYSPKAEEVRKVTIDENGTIVVNPSEGSDVMKEVEVTTRVNSGLGYDYTAIGYDREFSNAINNRYSEEIVYAREALDRFNNAGNKLYFFHGDIKIVRSPLLDLSTLSSLSNFYRDAINLTHLPNELNTPNNTSLYCTFSRCYSLKNMPQRMDTSNVTTFYNTWIYCYIVENMPDELNTDKVTTFALAWLSCMNLRKIKLTSIKNLVSGGMNNTFARCEALRELYFTEWMRYDINLSYSPLYTYSIKYIIWHALNGDNELGFENQGATSRILTLSATPYNSWETWKLTKPSVEDCEFLGIDETEITKYRELTWEDIALNVKLITIAK